MLLGGAKFGFPIKEERNALQKLSTSYKCPYQLEKFAESTNFLFTKFIAGGTCKEKTLMKTQLLNYILMHKRHFPCPKCGEGIHKKKLTTSL